MRTSACLYSAAFRCPVHKILHLVAVLPEDAQKLRSVGVLGFLAEESLHSPTKVRTVPRVHPVTACCNPVVAKGIPHSISNLGLVFNPGSPLVNPSAPKDVHARSASCFRGVPKFQCSGFRLPWFYHLWWSARCASARSSTRYSHAASLSDLWRQTA